MKISQRSQKIQIMDAEIAELQSEMENEEHRKIRSINSEIQRLRSLMSDELLSYRPERCFLAAGVPGDIIEWRRINKAGDILRIQQLMRACATFQMTQAPPPQNLFIAQAIKVIEIFQKTAMNNSQRWKDASRDTRTVDTDTYAPAMAWSEDGNLLGFEYLNFKLGARLSREYKLQEGSFDQGPTLAMDGCAYYTFFTHTSMAMFMKTIENIHPPAVKNLHIICKGYGEFNKDGEWPVDSKDTGELLPMYLDTYDAMNLVPFVKSVIECRAFIEAAGTLWKGQPVKRILVWLLERDHFEQFGWDTLYDERGKAIKHVLFMVSTVPGKELWNNPHGHELIVNEFKTKLIEARYISQDDNITVLEDLPCRAALRDSANRFDDIWCVLFAAFSTFLLANVIDIETWDGSGTTDAFWNFCRAGYHRFEDGLIAKIGRIVSDPDTTLWLGPEIAEKHLKIKDVYILTTRGAQKKKIEFNWKTGWYETAI